MYNSIHVFARGGFAVPVACSDARLLLRTMQPSRGSGRPHMRVKRADGNARLVLRHANGRPVRLQAVCAFAVCASPALLAVNIHAFDARFFPRGIFRFHKECGADLAKNQYFCENVSTAVLLFGYCNILANMLY